MKAKNFARAGRLIIAAGAFALTTAAPSALLAQAPPVNNAPDAKEYEAADALFRAGKFKDAVAAFEKFLEKYKMLSPRSLDAKFRLAIASVQEGLYDDAIRHLRELISNPKIDPAAREMAQLLVAKSLTLKASKAPADTDPQKAAQKKLFAEGVKEYETFIQSFPKSRDMDSAQFLRATLLLQMENYDEAIKGFATVARMGTSPYAWEALMWIGKTFFIQANALLQPKAGKEPPIEDVKKALGLFDNAEPSLRQAYQKSGDVALMNEAVFFVGQMQLTRSQHVTIPDEEQMKAKQAELLNSALEAFRAVRSVEEVVEAQTAKIAALEQQINLLPRGTVDYLPMKTRYENLIAFEDEKREKFKNGQDQYLAARLAIARIFLFLHKTDEARTLMRLLLAQKELFAKDKDAQATIAALLCLTYAEQKNAAKALETYQEFRKDFKGNPTGDNLALLVANLLVEKGQADQAEKVVAEGQADYKDWRFATEAMQILTASALKKGDYKKALDLCNQLLAKNPKPEIEAQTLFIKGSVEQAQLRETGDVKMADAALATFKTLRDRFPNDPQSEDAWFNSCQILAGRDPAKAITELNAFLAKYAASGGKSVNTKANIPAAQYLLGSALSSVNQQDKAVEAWKKVYEAYPESEAAPGAYFKVFDVLNEKKDYAAALKLMDDFVTKYPKHENVYYAYNNIAEFLFSGVLDSKKGASGGQPTVANIEAGAKKLLDYVDYETANNLEKKKGDGSLIKIADRWLKELSKLPIYLSLSEAQKQTWQKSVDGVTSAVERMLKDYPGSEKIAEALERLVTVQNVRRKAQQTDAAKVEAYFKNLAEQYGKTPLVKAKINMALASFLAENDPKRAFTLMDEAFNTAPQSAKVTEADGTERIAATFTPSDFDRRMSGLFDAKRYDDLTKMIARIRLEYPLGEKEDASRISHNILDAQAVALFWEAKLLQEQGKVAEAGSKFAELKAKFPKSTKALEADYGVILGEFEQTGQAKDDYIQRLSKVVNTQTGKSFELQAKALFLIGRIQEAKKEFDGAIETYEKINVRYASVPKIAAAGLWKAAELAEKQAKGESGYTVKTKQEKHAAAEARAAELKAKATPKPEEAKPAGAKPGDEKPGGPKPAPAKASPKTAAAALPQK
ncbi:MAG: tetratricopeptide repeat protein [Chthoniobacteraceae bacterium]